MAITGINYPWLNYGWDFGDPPRGWTGGLDDDAFRAAQRAAIAADLRNLASLGLEVVRWFILADGLAYGTGDEIPRADGHFLPLAPGDPSIRRVVDDFKAVLELCAGAGLKLLPSLIDFHWCFPAKSAGEGLVKCGRASILRDDLNRGVFLDTVLDPLLEASHAHREAIYAWEPINEPEWCTRTDAWKFWERMGPQRVVPLSAMRAYLKDAVSRINNSGFTSTVGFAHWDTIGDWHTEDLGIALQQFHYYAQGGAALPAASEVSDQPCLLGEFASAPAKVWPGTAAQSLDGRMRRAAELGYAGTLIWSMRATDDATLWNPAQQALVASVNGRVLSEIRA